MEDFMFLLNVFVLSLILLECLAVKRAPAQKKRMKPNRIQLRYLLQRNKIYCDSISSYLRPNGRENNASILNQLKCLENSHLKTQ